MIIIGGGGFWVSIVFVLYGIWFLINHSIKTRRKRKTDKIKLERMIKQNEETRRLADESYIRNRQIDALREESQRIMKKSQQTIADFYRRYPDVKIDDSQRHTF